MKIAVLVSGLPRFCEEFDSLIELLKNYDTDWYFYLWEKPYADFHDSVAPSWKNFSKSWAYDKIKNNLPTHHNIKGLEFGNQEILTIPAVENVTGYSIVERVWPMIYAHYQVSLLKQKVEKQTNINYDLVIKGRNDVILNEIYLEDINHRLTQSPESIFVSENNRHGFINPKINDLFLISNSKNIDTYCDLVNHVLKYNSEGVVFHSETMQAEHLNRNNLKVETKNFSTNFHTKGEWRNGTYYSKFGRWA